MTTLASRFDRALDRPVDAVTGWWRRLSPQMWVLHVCGLAFNAVVLAIGAHRQWFFFDEWDAIANRSAFGGHGTKGWLDPHNEHPFLIGDLWYRGMLKVFGLRTYLPYVAVVLVGQLIATHLLWRVMQRCGVRVGTATGVAFAFGMAGLAYENLLWAFQMTLVWSLVCGLGALLVMKNEGPANRRDGWAAALLVVSLMFSGVGLTMIIVVGVTTVARRRWSGTAVAAGIPAVVYAIWAKRYATAALEGGQPLKTGIRMAPYYTWTGMTRAFGAILGLDVAGPALLVLVLAGFVWIAGPKLGDLLPAAAMFGGSIAFLFLAGIRRSDLGIDSASASRYEHIVVALCVPLIAVGVDRVIRSRPMIVPAALVLLGMVSIVQVDTLLHQSDLWSTRSNGSKLEVLAAADIIRSGGTTFQTQVEAQWAPDLDTNELRGMVRAGYVPTPSVPTVNHLDAENTIQVALVPVGQATVPEGGLRVTAVSPAAAASFTPTGPGCAKFKVPAKGASFVVAASRAAAVRLDTGHDESIDVITSESDSFTVASGPRKLALPAAGGELALGRPGQHVSVQLHDAGTISLCGLASN